MTAATPNTLANAVADGQTLAAGIRPDVEVVLLDGRADGRAQWAESHSGYDAIHVLSHGAEGALHLGRNSLTDADFANAAVQAELVQLG